MYQGKIQINSLKRIIIDLLKYLNIRTLNSKRIYNWYTFIGIRCRLAQLFSRKLNSSQFLRSLINWTDTRAMQCLDTTIQMIRWTVINIRSKLYVHFYVFITFCKYVLSIFFIFNMYKI